MKRQSRLPSRKRLAKQARFLGRAMRGASRERHELKARVNILPHCLTWRRRNSRSDRPTLVIGLIEHLGDIIACEPVARHLRQQYPDAMIAWAVRPAYRCLVDDHPAIDMIVEINCLTQWMLLKRHGGFDQVVDLHVPGRSCDDCVAQLPASPHAPGINDANYYDHGCLLSIACQVAGLPSLDAQTPEMYLPDPARARVDALQLPTAFAVVHCKSNQQSRDWNDDSWLQFAQALHQQTGLAVVEVGLRSVLSDVPGVIDLCGQVSLLETAAVIERGRLFVGIDSGPAHMANAMHVPGVILLGRYSGFDRYMPYSGRYSREDHARIIHWPAPASEIPVKHVLEQVESLRAVVPVRMAAAS